MSRLRHVFFPLLMIVAAGGTLPAQLAGRVFVFPQGSGQSIAVLDAGTLAAVGTIPAPANVTQVVGLPDGSKYYLIAANPAQTVTVVNGSTLAVARQIALGANASAAVVTPDGRRLLVTAGSLRIFDTATDQEIGNVAAGTGPTDIEVSQDSTRAYVMSLPSGTITVVNLTNNSSVAQYAVPGPLSMALTPDNIRLLVLTVEGSLRAINPNTGGESFSPVSVPITTGKVLVTPDSSRAVILNRGFTPTVSSVVVDLATRAVTTIGAGGTQFDQIAIADNTTAFGLVSVQNSIAKIDLTTGSPAVQSYGAATRVLDLSPSGRNLYLVSLQNRTVTRVDVPSNVQQASQTLSIQPVGASIFVQPAPSGAVNMILNGGDRQNLLAGQTTAFPLSVKVTAADGTPVFNVPVTFSSSTTVTFSPPQPSRTNSRGVATVFVTVPAASSLTAGPEGQADAQALSPDGVSQAGGGIQFVTVTATAAGTPGVSFTLSVGTTTGITVVSGSYQMTRPNQDFAQPLVVRVTGTDGFPLVGASVTFFSIGGGAVFPPSKVVTTDADGVASAQFTGGTLGTQFSIATQVAATVDGRPELGQATFFLTLAAGLPTGLEIIQGDNQEGDINTTLSQQLCVQIGGAGPFTPLGLIGVNFDVVDGPAGPASAIPNPPVAVTGTNGVACTQLLLGSRAGLTPVVVLVRVLTVPNFQPAEGVRFRNIRIRGGPPERVIILQGNNQEGRPGQTLPLALRVRVLDIGGNPVPLPNSQFPLTFTVNPPGAAAISNFFQETSGEASVLVTIALNYVGQFTVVAAAGNGRADFTLRSVAVPAAIVRVSGQDQSVPIGGAASQPIVAQVNDAQGRGVPGIPVTFTGPASVTFVPASGPAGNPLTVNTGADGRATVSVRVQAGTAPGSITVQAGSQVGNVSFTLTVVGRTPSFTAAAILNAASFAAGMVPGGLATLFGTGLSEQITGCELPGGATSHRGVQLRIDGQAAPLFAICNQGGQEQINFQVRTDVPGPSSVRVEVVNNGASFSLSNVPVLRAQPGIFEYTPQGSSLRYAAAVKPDGSVVGPNNRVPRGTAFSIFLTGMGPSLPLLPTGQAAPTDPLAVTFFRPTVGIGGRGAEVLFSGLAPRFVGLNQINVLVPPDAPVGEAVTLDVIVEGVASQTSRIAVQ